MTTTDGEETEVVGPAGGVRLLGTLRASGGRGVVRIEEHFDTDAQDLWSALTDPLRLARWYGRVEGELRPRVPWTRSARSEPGRRLARLDRPGGVEVGVLDPGGEATPPVLEIRGLPLDRLAAYGAGWSLGRDLGGGRGGREADGGDQSSAPRAAARRRPRRGRDMPDRQLRTSWPEPQGAVSSHEGSGGAASSPPRRGR